MSAVVENSLVRPTEQGRPDRGVGQKLKLRRLAFGLSLVVYTLNPREKDTSISTVNNRFATRRYASMQGQVKWREEDEVFLQVFLSR
jgi:hypothetical protein